MSRIALVTDSTASLLPALVERYGIHVVPMKFLIDGRVCRDGIDIQPDQFYAVLSKASEPPTTSPPSADEFGELYAQLGREADAILCIHMSGGFSRTVPSALAAKERIDGSPVIEVIDSRSISMGLGFVVLMAARAIEEGKSLREVRKMVRELTPRMNVLLIVDSLEYLHKAGHIAKASKLLGTALDFKPILQIAEAQVRPLERVRTRKKAVWRLLRIMAERTVGAWGIHAAVAHAAARGEAENLREMVDRHFRCAELHVVELSPVIGALTGPGALGLIFYSEGKMG